MKEITKTTVVEYNLYGEVIKKIETTVEKEIKHEQPIKYEWQQPYSPKYPYTTYY